MSQMSQMSKRQKKFLLIALGLAILASVTALVLNAFQSNLVFFFTPTQVFAGEAPKGRAFRIGGMVKVSSLVQVGMTHEFVVTDNEREVKVSFTGLLPDLFKEGRGVVAQGELDPNGRFVASQVLAKHDENYMPPEAQHAMDAAAQRRAAQSLKP
jgi:cytochrome c-type biogenesis protein CcmE